MPKASDNPFPSLLLVEGAVPADPPSGDQRLYLDSSDHHLKRVDSTGVIVDLETGGGSTSPLTTKGDLWGYDTADDRIPVGTDGQVLTADSGAAAGLSWQTPSSSGLNIVGAWSAGSYSVGDVVTRDGVTWLCVAATSDPPGSLWPPLRFDAYDLTSNAIWLAKEHLRLTSASSRHGTAEAKTARPMQPFDFSFTNVFPAADQMFLTLIDDADSSKVTDDYQFASNNGIAILLEYYSGATPKAQILSRTTHGATATVEATANHTWGYQDTFYSPSGSYFMGGIRVTVTANGANYDVTVYDTGGDPPGTVSVVTATSLAFPADVIPQWSAWCGGSGGPFEVRPLGDAGVSADWMPLGLTSIT